MRLVKSNFIRRTGRPRPVTLLSLSLRDSDLRRVSPEYTRYAFYTLYPIFIRKRKRIAYACVACADETRHDAPHRRLARLRRAGPLVPVFAAK